jgi:hypothetical protein
MDQIGKGKTSIINYEYVYAIRNRNTSSYKRRRRRREIKEHAEHIDFIDRQKKRSFHDWKEESKFIYIYQRCSIWISFCVKKHPRGSVCCDMFKYPNFLLHSCFLFLARFSIKQNQYHMMLQMTTKDAQFSSINRCINEYSVCY